MKHTINFLCLYCVPLRIQSLVRADKNQLPISEYVKLSLAGVWFKQNAGEHVQPTEDPPRCCRHAAHITRTLAGLLRVSVTG
jgi:hypothetical protein